MYRNAKGIYQVIRRHLSRVRVSIIIMHFVQELIQQEQARPRVKVRKKVLGKLMWCKLLSSMTLLQARAPLLMVWCLFPILGLTHFYTSTSHSFIFVLFVSIHGLKYETLDSTLSVSALLGRDCELSYCCSSLHIETDHWWFLVDLIIRPLDHFDVTLDMDWLPRYLDRLCM